MREVITAAELKKKIAERIEAELEHRSTSDMSVFWFPTPVRCERNGDGPNWRLALDTGKVPAAFVAAWESIRSVFEDRYDIAVA
jgi:hypothetical protein